MYWIRVCAYKVVKKNCELVQDEMLEKTRDKVTGSLKLPIDQFGCRDLYKCDYDLATRTSFNFAVLVVGFLVLQ